MCSPFDYFACMIFMMKQIEKEEQTIYNVFPMRSEVIPKHIRLDTTTLVHLLMTKKQGNKSDYLTKGNLKRKEDKIWEFFFRTERKFFKKKYYEFHNMIETDGVSCSLLLLRKDLVGKKLPMMKKGLSTETYIDELTDYSSLQNKKIVGIDPGKCDLIYCVDDCNKEANKFRYSQDQRRKETKKKKFSKIQLELKKEKINYSCLCGMDFGNRIDNYNRHINKKNPCFGVAPKAPDLPQILPQNIPLCIEIKPIYNEIETEKDEIETEKDEIEPKEETKNKFSCPFCFQNFVKKYGLNRHLDGRCKIKSELNNNKSIQ